MKKIKILSLLLIAFLGTSLFALPSCRDKKQIRSLSKMLKDESANIEKFIHEKGIKVKKYTPSQTDFEEGVYYLFDNNLYMRVIDKGTTSPVAGKTHVVVRFKGFFFTQKKVLSFDNLSSADYQNTEILYVDTYDRGARHYQLLPPSPGANLNKIMCEGMAFPLSLLGDGARVSLIIPFSLASEQAYKGGFTMFCDEVWYQFYLK